MKFKDEASGCPVRKALSVIGGKWKLLLIYQIGEQSRRYGELKRLLPDITERILILQLKELVDDGLLARKSYGEVPPRVEYALTERGKRVLLLVEQLERFGLEYVAAEI
ncbi:winged helix-turn-helix transcriptional regulator [Spirosoma arcticum]